MNNTTIMELKERLVLCSEQMAALFLLPQQSNVQMNQITQLQVNFSALRSTISHRDPLAFSIQSVNSKTVTNLPKWLDNMGNIDEYLINFESAVKIYKIPENLWPDYLSATLSDNVIKRAFLKKNVLDIIPIPTWAETKQILIAEYLTKLDIDTRLTILKNFTINKFERPDQFASRFGNHFSARSTLRHQWTSTLRHQWNIMKNILNRSPSPQESC
jgi:hypothetical protein